MFNQFYSVLSLKSLDNIWQNAIAQSCLLGCIRQSSNALFSRLKNPHLGSLLQTLSFYINVVLFSILPLPYFTNDKEGLALISLAALVIWLAGTIFGGNEKRKGNAIDLIVIIYGCINIIAAASSHYFPESLKGLAKVLVYLSSYFLLTAQMSFAPKRKLVFTTVLLITSTLLSLYGLYQYKIGVAPLATWEDPNIEDKATRIYATLNNPNLLAGYLLAAVPLALSCCLAFLVQKRWLFSLLLAFVFLVTTLATILTGSRGGYLGLVAGLIAIAVIFGNALIKERPRWRPIIFIGALLFILAIFASLHYLPSLEQRIASIFAGREHSSNSFRMNVWSACLTMLKDNWWFGIGVGNQAFRLAYGLYMRSGFDALGAYCVPLEIAVETGVFGLLAFAVLLLAILCRAHLNFTLPQATWHKYLSAGATASLIAMTIHGLVDTVFYRPQVHFIFWLIVSILVATPAEKMNSELSTSKN